MYLNVDRIKHILFALIVPPRDQLFMTIAALGLLAYSIIGVNSTTF